MLKPTSTTWSDLIPCSFMDMSTIEDNTFDRGYAIESTCHAPDKQGAFAEIFRVLKPGALFWGQEMCLTGKFDASDDRHQEIKQDLMRGIALNDIATFQEVNQALETVGFQVLEGIDRDVQLGPSTPWYQPMESRHGTLGSALRRLPQGPQKRQSSEPSWLKRCGSYLKAPPRSRDFWTGPPTLTSRVASRVSSLRSTVS